MELDIEMGEIVFVGMVIVSLAARSLPGIKEWPGIYCTNMEGDMELMEL